MIERRQVQESRTCLFSISRKDLVTLLCETCKYVFPRNQKGPTVLGCTFFIHAVHAENESEESFVFDITGIGISEI